MNLGVLGAIGGAASSASEQIGFQMKQDAEARARDQNSAIRMREEAATELRKEAAAQRAAQFKQDQSAKMGQQINDRASGVLNASDANAINTQFGSNMSAEDAKVLNDNPAARKAYGLPDDTESAKIGRQAEAAGVLGDTPRQKELYDRKKDIETANRDDERNKTAIDANLLREKIAEAKAENDERKADILQKKLDYLLSGGSKADKAHTVVDANGKVKILSAKEINAGEYNPVSSIETTRKTDAAEEAANLKTAAQVAKEIEKLQDLKQAAPRKKKNAEDTRETQDDIQAKINNLLVIKRGKQGLDAPTAQNNDPLGIRK